MFTHTHMHTHTHAHMATQSWQKYAVNTRGHEHWRRGHKSFKVVPSYKSLKAQVAKAQLIVNIQVMEGIQLWDIVTFLTM